MCEKCDLSIDLGIRSQINNSKPVTQSFLCLWHFDKISCLEPESAVENLAVCRRPRSANTESPSVGVSSTVILQFLTTATAGE